MKRILVVLAAAVALAGCGTSSEKSNDTAMKDDHAGSMTEQHADAAPATEQKPAAEVIPAGTEVTLTGAVGCGHCTYHIGTHCSAAMQTADGTIWILDGIEEGNEIFDNRFDGGEITMAGTVSYVDGVAHLAPKMDEETPTEM